MCENLRRRSDFFEPKSFLISNLESLKILLINTEEYIITILMRNFLYNNSQKTANNYEVATVIKVILVNFPDLIFPYITREDVHSHSSYYTD